MKKYFPTILPTIILIIYITTFAIGLLLQIKVFIVTSNSMLPTFGVGDVLLAERQEHYSPEDIISFKVEESIVTHRIKSIIKKEGNTFFETKGDSNKSADSLLITKAEVLGKVNFIIPKLGYLILFLQSKFVSISLVLVTILYLSKLLYMVIK